MDNWREQLVAWLQSDEVVMTLVNHQRKDITGCVCGWGELGRMHSRHVAAKLAALVEEANIGG